MSQLTSALEMCYKSVSIVSMSEIGINRKHFNVEHLLKIAKILQIDMFVVSLKTLYNGTN